MSAIDPKYLTCTVYLYPSLEAGERGEKTGGTGFLVGFPAPDGSQRHYRYVVTNRHVVESGGRFVRVGMKDGTSQVGEVPMESWTLAPDDDLAVAPLGAPEGHDTLPFDPDLFIAEDCQIEGWAILPGDEAMFYGRFISHDGNQRNKPVLRFGNIAMLPDVDALINLGSHKQLAFLVECRSVSGFSGSPVFVKLAQPRQIHRDNSAGLDKKWIPSGARFLGVNCGHLPHFSPAREHPSSGAPRVVNVWTETNSGMAVVIPAWRLLDLFNTPSLVKARDEAWRRTIDEASPSSHSAE